MRRLLATLLLVVALPACGADYSARVVGVSDGDTITVLTAAKRQVKIRLHGIDAPETGQDFGGRAKQAASEPAFGICASGRCRACGASIGLDRATGAVRLNASRAETIRALVR